MKCHEEDTPTTTTRVVTTKITTGIKMDTMVKRIGTKTPKVPIRRMSTLH